MANEIKLIAGTEYTLEGSGAIAASGAYILADDATLTAAQVNGYPALIFEFSGALNATGTNAAVIDIYMRPVNFDGTNDNQIPSSNYQHTWVACIPYDSGATTTTFYYRTPVISNPHPLDECEVYICNRTGQQLNAGWVLRAIPATYMPV